MTIATFIADNRGGHIGLSSPRADGPPKVHGQARYAAEYMLPGMLHGVPVQSHAASGRIVAIHADAARAMPGVVAVITHETAPEQEPFAESDDAMAKIMGAKPMLATDRILFHGHFVALVVADSYETARDAAFRVEVEIEGGHDALNFGADQAYAPAHVNGGYEADSDEGTFDAAFAAAPVKVDATYDTPYEHNAAMEPHAAVAEWQDGRLTIHDCNQGPSACAVAIANTFKLQPKDVRIVSRYVGGGFGSKYGIHPHNMLAAIGAKVTGRPVKVALSRQHTFNGHGHRSRTEQRVRLAAGQDGKLVALAHDNLLQTSTHDEFVEQSGILSRLMYEAPNRRTTHRVVRLNMPTPAWMRAPGEAPGSFALESAMDELAVALGMDPIALRLANEPPIDPETKLPWSTRSLRACLEQGAAKFGWSGRKAPGANRHGRTLVGMGVAAASYPVLGMPASAKLTLNPDGTALVQLAATDIGQGTYTVLRQIAAAALGIEEEAVTVEIGDSDLPMTSGSGGSFGLSSFGSALTGAAEAVRARVVERAREAGPLRGVNDDDLVFDAGRVQRRTDPDAGESLVALLGRGGAVVESYDYKPSDAKEHYSMHSFGAQFAEVGVDMDTGEVRIRRLLGAFGVGRVMNPRTATSQVLGGLTMGIGQALTEETVMDPRWGQWVNRDLGEYHVPVQADVPVIEALFVEEHDDKVNAMGTKGVGEIGIVGVAAAIANAVFNATGVRVRDLPITLDKVLPGLPIAD